MSIITRRTGKYIVVCPGAELSMPEDVERLSDKLNRLLMDGEKNICVDLSNSPVINSCVIGTISSFNEKLRSKGGCLCILNARSFVLEVLLRTHLDRMIKIVKSEAELL